MSTRTTRRSIRIQNIAENSPSVPKKVTTSKRRQQKNLEPPIENDANESNESSDETSNVNVTPPKVRKACEKQNALSPSTLLHRLSLGEQDENQSNKVNVREHSKSKMDNARKVLTTVETEDLYGREKELNELGEFLTTNADQKQSASIYVSGQPGECYILLYFGRNIKN